MIQRALAHPDRSWLRKMSLNTTISSQIQMKNRKNHRKDKNTCPVPHSAATGTTHSPDVVANCPVYSDLCPERSDGIGRAARLLHRPDCLATSPSQDTRPLRPSAANRQQLTNAITRTMAANRMGHNLPIDPVVMTLLQGLEPQNLSDSFGGPARPAARDVCPPAAAAATRGWARGSNRPRRACPPDRLASPGARSGQPRSGTGTPPRIPTHHA